MNQKGFANMILVVAVVILLGAVGYFAFVKKSEPIAQQPTPAQQPTFTPTQTVDPIKAPVSPTPNAAPSGNADIYQNTTLGFQLKLPNKSWVSEPGDDPHLYANEECSKLDRINCAALEAQNNDSEFAQGPDAAFDSLKAEGQNPVKLSSLIPGAIVIKSKAPGPAEGWSYEYDIFFQTIKKRFLIFTNDVTLEKSVLPTFKLMN